MDSAKKGAHRAFIIASISIVAIIITVSLLFYLSPKDKASAGQAILLGQENDNLLIAESGSNPIINENQLINLPESNSIVLGDIPNEPIPNEPTTDNNEQYLTAQVIPASNSNYGLTGSNTKPTSNINIITDFNSPSTTNPISTSFSGVSLSNTQLISPSTSSSGSSTQQCTSNTPESNKICKNGIWVTCNQETKGNSVGFYTCCDDGTWKKKCETNTLNKCTSGTKPGTIINNGKNLCSIYNSKSISIECNPKSKNAFTFIKTGNIYERFDCDGTTWKKNIKTCSLKNQLLNDGSLCLYVSQTNQYLVVSCNIKGDGKLVSGITPATQKSIGFECKQEGSTAKWVKTGTSTTNACTPKGTIVNGKYCDLSGKLISCPTDKKGLAFLSQDKSFVGQCDQSLQFIKAVECHSKYSSGEIVFGYFCNPVKELWLTCEQATVYEQTDGYKLTCDNSKVLSATEAKCTDKLDNDGDGKIDTADGDCITGAVISNDKQFEIDVNLDSFKDLKITTPTGQNIQPVKIISIPSIIDTIDLQYSQSKISLPRLDLMKNSVLKPHYDKSLGLSFLYPKRNTVSIHATYVLSEKALILNKNNFIQNILKGEKIMLILNNEYYLLKHPVGKQLEVNYLTLQHIPSLVEYKSKVIPGQVGKYFFNVLGGYSISLSLITNNVEITSLSPSESPSGMVTPVKLDEDYETHFTLKTPVRIESPYLGTLTLCKEDRAADLNNALICLNNNFVTTLTKGELKKIQLNTQFPVLDVNGKQVVSNNVPQYQTMPKNYAMLYEISNNEKIIYVFDLVNPSKTPIKLSYRNFIDNMIEGRRIAFEFKDNLYLIDHGKSDSTLKIFSLTNLSLTVHNRREIAKKLEMKGDEDKVFYDISGDGKISITRKENSPPPPFELVALSPEQIEAKDLAKDLSVEMSSNLPIQINNPALGKVEISSKDVKSSMSRFVITTQKGDFILEKDIPNEIDTNTLAYYYEAALENNKFVKHMMFYYFVDITKNIAKIPFNDELIKKFTNKRKFAIKFDKSYYLLSYKGTGFFDISKLIITDLDGKNPKLATLIDRKVQFKVAEGEITISENGVELLISKEIKDDLTTSTFNNYFAEIAPETKVSLSNSLTLRMCYLTAYSLTQAARVCGSDGTEYELNPITIINHNNIEYVLESNKKTGDQKRVFVRKIIPISPKTTIPDWFGFVKEIIGFHEPILKIVTNGYTLYKPIAKGPELAKFGLQKYPLGPAYNFQTRQTSPITFEGKSILGENILLLEQVTTKDEQKPVDLNVNILPYLHLPVDGTSIIINSSKKTEFTVDLGQHNYTIQVINWFTRTKLIDIEIYENIGPKPLKLILKRYLKEGDSKLFTAGDVKFELKVKDVGSEQNAALVKTAYNVTITRK